ncbi:MAG TPA: hypothetical protein VGL25_01375 [Casimicrobiaceae bacterium]
MTNPSPPVPLGPTSQPYRLVSVDHPDHVAHFLCIQHRYHSRSFVEARLCPREIAGQHAGLRFQRDRYAEHRRWDFEVFGIPPRTSCVQERCVALALRERQATVQPFEPPDVVEVGTVEDRLDGGQRTLRAHKIAARKGGVEFRNREPDRDIRLRMLLHERKRALFCAFELDSILVQRADPKGEPAAESVRRQIGSVDQRLDQRVDAIGEFALLARLGVEQQEPSGSEFEVDVELQLGQAHDPFDAAIAIRVGWRQHQHAGQQARMRQQILVAPLERQRSIAHTGERREMFAKPPIPVHGLTGHQQRGGT